jgi:hypothetical protein
VIVDACRQPPNGPLQDGDVLVVTQKIVSKAEGRLVPIDADDPRGHKGLVEEEAVRVLRRRGDLVITETRHGFVCANSGVDLSNVERGYAALLPIDSDRSARRIRDGVRAHLAIEVGIIVSDTFGRPWRKGLTDVAIGVAVRRRRRPPQHRRRPRPHHAGDRGRRGRQFGLGRRTGDGQVGRHPVAVISRRRRRLVARRQRRRWNRPPPPRRPLPLALRRCSRS